MGAGHSRHPADSGGQTADPATGWPPRDLDSATRLLDRPDGDTLDPFVVRWDKRRLYSADRRAAVGFGLVHRVGLATGDPIGDPAAYDDSVRRFVELCDERGWLPAALGPRADTSEIYQRHGLRSMYVGDEAIIDTDSFTVDGRRRRNVRQAVARTQRCAVTTEFHREGDLDARLRWQLLGFAGQPDRSFAMGLGGLFTGAYPECLIVLARDRSGRPVGFQRYVSCRRGGALSLDSMRRIRGAPNGINERMIVDTIGWGRDHGVTEVSLNFAAFRRVFDGSVELTRSEALRTSLLRRLEGRFGIQMDTLRRFDAKFGPRWVPRYLIYRSTRDLPRIGLAALRAEGLLPSR